MYIYCCLYATFLHCQTLATDNSIEIENAASLYIGIALDPGFSKYDSKIYNFSEPNLKTHDGTLCYIAGSCGLHLAAFQPSFEAGLIIGVQFNNKLSISSGLYYANNAGKLLVDGLMFDQENGILIPNSMIDSAYAFSHPLNIMTEITFRGNYIVFPILFHFGIPGDRFKANLELGTRQYFMLHGKASGEMEEITLLHNSYGVGSTVDAGNIEIDNSEDLRNFFIAWDLGAELIWKINDHLHFYSHLFSINSFTNIMNSNSVIFLSQYGSSNSFDMGGKPLPLGLDFHMKKYGIGLGLQYAF